MISDVIDLVTILIALSPVIVKVVKLISQKTHNERLKNLSARAEIVVNALEQSGLTSAEKKKNAYDKLSVYAKEVGIPVTGDQLDDYIESAVRIVKSLTS